MKVEATETSGTYLQADLEARAEQVLVNWIMET